MKIFIITMDDPIEINTLIGKIIEKKSNIVGNSIPKGNRFTIQNNKSKFAYVVSLLL